MNKPKAIAYSLFGYNKEKVANSFDFNGYLRGLMVNIRLNRLLFPGWFVILETDRPTYDAFKSLFDNLPIVVEINEEADLCKAMLWRLKPVFHQNRDLSWTYSHVICRDLDSPPTYRDAQAVQYWVMRDKAMHAICDSVSHNLPLMGGMIGARPDYFTDRVAQSWEAMLSLAPQLSFVRKGTDQEFLNEYIYPRFAKKGTDSITQHYFNGHGDTFLSDFKTCTCPPVRGHDSHCLNNTDLPLHADLRESNNVCGHIGAAGYYQGPLFNFLKKFKDQFTDLLTIEKNYPKELFFWAHDGTFD